MGIFQAYYTSIHDLCWQPRAAAQLHEQGLVTFSGIANHAELVALARQLMTIRPLSNSRWLHGRDSFTGHRTMLRVLGDPLPGTGIMPGFPSPTPATGTQAPQAA